MSGEGVIDLIVFLYRFLIIRPGRVGLDFKCGVQEIDCPAL